MNNPTHEIAPPDHPQVLLPPPGTTPPPPDQPKPPRHRWLWIVLVLLLALVGLGYFLTHSKPSAQKGGAASGKGKKGGAAAVTPVVAVQAQKGNIGVYVTGLGAITPIYTVTVKSRVDGQLMNVYFKEGQLVKQGEPLVEIDTRPYEAVVTQIQGQLLRD